MREADLEPPFLDNQLDSDDWSEPAGPPRKDLCYHGDIRRLLEIRRELLQLQQDLADFDEKELLPEDPLSIENK